jgi:hypothetical protein
VDDARLGEHTGLSSIETGPAAALHAVTHAHGCANAADLIKDLNTRGTNRKAHFLKKNNDFRLYLR